jgi:hypothetical protein
MEHEESEPVYATVFQRDGRWWLRTQDSVGSEVSRDDVGWDGSGGFFQEGLDHVVKHLPPGFVYTSWDEGPAGTFSAILHRTHRPLGS